MPTRHIRISPTADDLRPRLASTAWRIANLHTIQAGGTEENPEIGLVAFTPNHAQREYFNSSHNLDAILKARKLGLSTFKAVQFADFATFTPRITLGIIDYTLDDAKKKLRMVRTSWEHLDNGDIHPETWRLGRRLKKRNPLISDSKESLEWHNGAMLDVSTSYRGANPIKLHLSEFGKIAAFAPIRAQEIVNGAFNAILPGMSITSESTHEAGMQGEHYLLLKRAMAAADRPVLTYLDWRLHFFPWFHHPLYTADPGGQALRPETVQYFNDLRDQHGITLTPGQMFWYDRKQEEQGYGMKKEFPSTPGEAFEALIRGSIWGESIADLRAAGRVTDLSVGPEPLYTFWDLGFSDYTAIWLIQLAGRDILVHDFYENHRLETGRYAEIIRQWERKYSATIAHHFLPHDADSHGGGGISPRESLVKAGIQSRTITRVDRTQDPWVEINHARTLFPRMYFNRATTDTERERNGDTLPSGLVCLENYKTKTVKASDYETNLIVHDQFSHPAAALRTFSSADLLGLIRHVTGARRTLVTPTTPSPYSPTHRRRPHPPRL